jgi:tRNA1(Val) A37 N6-methylase TrmN6
MPVWAPNFALKVPEPMLDCAPETTVDAFLGGRVEAVQPARGHHRSGLDAVVMAAALGPRARGRVADLGAGAGVAGLSLAARAPSVSVVLVERESELVACSRAALARAGNAAFAAMRRANWRGWLRRASTTR